MATAVARSFSKRRVCLRFGQKNPRFCGGFFCGVAAAAPQCNLRRWRRSREIPAFAGMGKGGNGECEDASVGGRDAEFFRRKRELTNPPKHKPLSKYKISPFPRKRESPDSCANGANSVRALPAPVAGRFPLSREWERGGGNGECEDASVGGRDAEFFRRKRELTNPQKHKPLPKYKISPFPRKRESPDSCANGANSVRATPAPLQCIIAELLIALP